MAGPQKKINRLKSPICHYGQCNVLFGRAPLLRCYSCKEKLYLSTAVEHFGVIGVAGHEEMKKEDIDNQQKSTNEATKNQTNPQKKRTKNSPPNKSSLGFAGHHLVVFSGRFFGGHR